MKASDYLAQQLLGQDESYGARFASQPRVQMSVRLPVELIAWIDALKVKGLGDSRNEVLTVMLDVAVEQITSHGICGDASELSDLVDAIKDQLELRLTEGE